MGQDHFTEEEEKKRWSIGNAPTAWTNQTTLPFVSEELLHTFKTLIHFNKQVFTKSVNVRGTA